MSPLWLRHADASHAIDHGATLTEVQATLGGNVSLEDGMIGAASIFAGGECNANAIE